MSIISPMRSPLKPAIGLETGGGGPSYTLGEQLVNGDFAAGDLSSWTLQNNSPGATPPSIGLYGTNSPFFGWPAGAFPSPPQPVNDYFCTGGSQTGQSVDSGVYQEFPVQAGSSFTLAAGFSARYSGNNTTYVRVDFLDGGGSPISIRNRLSYITSDPNYVGDSFIQINDARRGMVVGASDVFTIPGGSNNFSMYYLSSNKEVMLLRDSPTNTWYYYTSDGTWDADDIADTFDISGRYTKVAIGGGSDFAVEGAFNWFYPSLGQGGLYDYTDTYYLELNNDHDGTSNPNVTNGSIIDGVVPPTAVDARVGGYFNYVTSNNTCLDTVSYVVDALV